MLVRSLLSHFELVLQVKLRNDMPDDMLKDAIETARRIINDVEDFEVQGIVY